MPLVAGNTRKAIGANISELTGTGRPRKQVIAIALKKAGINKPVGPKAQKVASYGVVSRRRPMNITDRATTLGAMYGRG